MKQHATPAAEKPVAVWIFGKWTFFDESLEKLINDSGKFKVIRIEQDAKLAKTYLPTLGAGIALVCYQFDNCRGDELVRHIRMYNENVRIAAYSPHYSRDQ